MIQLDLYNSFHIEFGNRRVSSKYRERERERHTHTHRQTDRHTDRQKLYYTRCNISASKHQEHVILCN